jgi:hypothetical protein
MLKLKVSYPDKSDEKIILEKNDALLAENKSCD